MIRNDQRKNQRPTETNDQPAKAPKQSKDQKTREGLDVMVCCVLSNYIGLSVLLIIPLDFNCNTKDLGELTSFVLYLYLVS